MFTQPAVPMSTEDGSETPVAIFCVGMAGSGKTTFMQRINSHLHAKGKRPYVINLDPAVRSVPFEANIDIRDSVNYKEVMKQYNLGPNGGILTSLNLYATKIDQVLRILEKRCKPMSSTPSTTSAEPQSTASQDKPSPHGHIILDTPGQIEAFVWSASGNILLSALASSYPTVIAYVIDTPRTTSSTSTFMSNMLYAISILYKMRLPMILVFNKTDVKDETEAVEWMRDFDTFQAALRQEEEDQQSGRGAGGSGYMHSLLNSMSLVLEEFYNNLSVVGVSSMSGHGVDDFFRAVEGKRKEFMTDYAPELERRRAEMETRKESRREADVSRMMAGMSVGNKTSSALSQAARDEPETLSEAEDMSDDDEGDLVDRDETDEDLRAAGLDDLSQRYAAAMGKTSGATSNAHVNVADYIQGTKHNI